MNIMNNMMITIIVLKIIKSGLYCIESKGRNIRKSADYKPSIGGFWGGRYTCFKGFNSVKALKIYKAPKGYKDSFTSQKSHA